MRILPELPQPALQQQIQWVLDPIRYLQTCELHSPGMFRSVVNDGLLVLSDPEALKCFLAADRSQLSAPAKTNKILEPITGPSSIFSTEGDQHLKRRKLLLPPFHGERLKSYGEAIVDITHQCVASLAPNERILGRSLTQQLTLAVIFKTVFGLQEGKKYQPIKALLTTITDSFSSPLNSSFLFFELLQQDWGPWSPWGRFVRRRSRLDKMVYQEITERRQRQAPGDDILSLMITAEYDDGSHMTDQELRDELMALLFAGHETTASALAWALYWVCRYPTVKTKIREELAQLSPDAGVMAIAQLPYLSAVCNETLRIYPVALMTFSRIAEHPLTIMDVAIAKGTQLIGCLYLLHQNPVLYPNPEQFRPERFLERQFAPYEYMPFGGGQRRCIGDALALLEMKLGLATLLTHYDFILQDDRPEVPQRRGVTLAPKRNVPLQYQGKRNSPVPDVLHPSSSTMEERTTAIKV